MASFEQLPSGKWRAIVRVNGKKVPCPAHQTMGEAREWATAIEYNRNNDGIVASKPTGTVAWHIQKYCQEYAQQKKWGPTKDYALAALSKDLGHIQVAKLRQQDLVEYAKRLRDRKKRPLCGETIGGRLSYLNEVFKAATVEWGVHRAVQEEVQNALDALRKRDIIYNNPARDRQTNAQEVNRIKDAAFASFGPAATIPLADMIHILEVLPLRTGELLKIKWQDFDPETRMVWLRARKHPNPRMKARNDEKIPLPKIKGRDTWDLLAGRSREGTDGPFDCISNSVAHAWRRAAKRAGAADLHMHDLRAHAITEMMMAGVKLTSIMRVSGHKNYKVMLGRYARINPQAVADEIELLMNDQEKAEVQADIKAADIKAKGAKLRLVA